MTDQETLNKLFEAALNAPETIKSPGPRYATQQIGSRGSAAMSRSPVVSGHTTAGFVRDTPTLKREAPAPPQAKPNATIQEVQPSTEAKAEVAADPTPAKPKSGKHLLIIATVLVVCAIAAGVWIYLHR